MVNVEHAALALMIVCAIRASFRTYIHFESHAVCAGRFGGTAPLKSNKRPHATNMPLGKPGVTTADEMLTSVKTQTIRGHEEVPDSKKTRPKG